MMKKINISRVVTLSLFVLGAAMTRLLPHPPNFAPLTAVAVFSGFYMAPLWAAFLIPVAAMLLSDALIGFHSGMFLVYGCFAAMVFLGNLLQSKKSFMTIAGTLLASNFFFFLVTNAAEWPGNPMYAQDISGLLQSYIAALPFYGNSLLGDVFYSAVLFGGFAAVERFSPAIRAQNY